MANIKETTKEGKVLTVSITLAADEYIVFIEAKKDNSVRTARIDFVL